MSRYPLGHNSVQRVVHSGEQAGMSVCSTVHAVQCSSALDAELRPAQYKQVCLQQHQQGVSFEAEQQADTLSCT